MKKIAITTGDPNGIGLEITIKALNYLNINPNKIVIISNLKLLNFYKYKLNKEYEVIEIPYDYKNIIPGQITKEAGEFSYQSLKKACQIKPQAIVTAPISKKALYLSKHYFNGQTEILQKYLGHDKQIAQMLFVAKNFRVLLLTRHYAIKNIVLTKNNIIEQVNNLVNSLKQNFKIKKPRIALCGFNPHAGEDGILGSEEKDILIPAINELNEQGINITKPLPADTLFYDAAQAYLNNKEPQYDCYIACYHDQGLIPIKTVAGMNTVNTTIGLDIIRTSPGHGTAFDIAGLDKADPTSMIEAIKQVL